MREKVPREQRDIRELREFRLLISGLRKEKKIAKFFRYTRPSNSEHECGLSECNLNTRTCVVFAGSLFSLNNKYLFVCFCFFFLKVDLI